jgi:hypothetical protein
MLLAALVCWWPCPAALAGGAADALGRHIPAARGGSFSEQLHAWRREALPLKVYIEPVPASAGAHSQDYRRAWQDFGGAAFAQAPTSAAPPPVERAPATPDAARPPESAARPRASIPGEAAAATQLLEAAERGLSTEVSRLLSAGEDVNIRDDNGWTPLIAAASQGHSQTVALLIERGADINLKDYEGYTALRYARANGHTRVVEQLRAAGAKE